MVIDRRRQAEQRLQQAMHAGRPEQVLPAHHMGHALQRVVDHDRRGGSWSAFPCAPRMTSPQAAGSAATSPRLAGWARAGLGPAQRAGPFHRLRHVEADRIGLAAGDARLRAPAAVIWRAAPG